MLGFRITVIIFPCHWTKYLKPTHCPCFQFWLKPLEHLCLFYNCCSRRSCLYSPISFQTHLKDAAEKGSGKKGIPLQVISSVVVNCLLFCPHVISIVHLFLQYSCLEKKLRLNTALCKIKKSAFAMLSLVTGSCGMCYRILSFKCSDEILLWIIIH